MSSVMQAGPCVRSNQLDYDEDVMHKVSEWNPLHSLSFKCQMLTLHTRLSNTSMTMSALILRHGGHLL